MSDSISRNVLAWLPVLAVGILLGLVVPMGTRAPADAPGARVGPPEPAPSAEPRPVATKPPAPARQTASDDDGWPARFAAKSVAALKRGKHARVRAVDEAESPSDPGPSTQIDGAPEEPRREKGATVDSVGEADLMARRLLEQSLR